METSFIYELIGYAASLLVAISLMMSNILRLRVVNMAGAAVFCIYGILINSVPVALMNAFIVLVNIYYIIQMWTSKEYFKLLPISAGNEFLSYFIKFYQDEIERNQPSFGFDVERDDICLFTLRNTVPAGLFVGNLKSDGTLDVKLDFATPSYRDYKIGRFLFYESRTYFANRGVTRIIANGDSSEHKNYLKRMGFSQKGEDTYEFELNS